MDSTTYTMSPEGQACQDVGNNIPEDYCLRMYTILNVESMNNNFKLGEDRDLMYGSEATKHFMLFSEKHEVREKFSRTFTSTIRTTLTKLSSSDSGCGTPYNTRRIQLT